MADYYPVLKRAISSLPTSSGEARRAVYEKARSALVKQLQSYDPPLSPAEVTDQRLALEECIRRVESETAGAAFGLPVEPAPPPPPPPRSEAPPPPQDLPQKVTVRVPPPVITRPEPDPNPAPPQQRQPEPAPDPKIEAGLSAFTNTLRQAETLGGASSLAVRSARDAIEVAPGQPEPPPPQRPIGKIEPDLGGGLRRPPSETVPPLFPASPGASASPPPLFPAGLPGSNGTPAPSPALASETAPVPSVAGGDRPLDANRSRPLRASPPKSRSRVPAIAAAVLLLTVAGGGAYVFVTQMQGDQGAPPPAGQAAGETPAPTSGAGDSAPSPSEQAALPAQTPEDTLDPKIEDRLPQEGVPTEPVAPDAVTVQTEDVPAQPVDPSIPGPPQSSETPIVAQAPADGVPDVDPPTAEETPAVPPATDAPGASEPVPATDAPAAPAVPAVPEAVPAPAIAEAGPPAAGEPQVVVAQRAILYEEPIPGSEGARVEGRVLWSFVNEPVLPGEAPAPQIRARIEIPERNVNVLMSIRKNADQALPASHIVELKFELPAGFAGTAIDTTPGLIIKPTEDARGDPLIGAVAKVADNLFWLALSGLDQDATRNVALLMEGQWIDIPIRYMNRRRAILTFEKGSGGAEVFQSAFAAWGR